MGAIVTPTFEDRGLSSVCGARFAMELTGRDPGNYNYNTITQKSDISFRQVQSLIYEKDW